MKITPLEIRQKNFEREFRGFDKEEVNAYLLSLSQEWERLQDELKELRLTIKNSEKEVEKLRQVESSLYKTLKTAEDTGANLIDQASKTADLHLRESQMKAESLLIESKNQAKDMIEEAEMKSKMVIEEMEMEIKNLHQAYRVMANNYDNLLTDLKNLSQDTLSRVEKGRTIQESQNIDQVVQRALNYSKQSLEEVTNKTKSAIDKQKDVEMAKKPEKNQEESGSFFDQIE